MALAAPIDYGGSRSDRARHRVSELRRGVLAEHARGLVPRDDSADGLAALYDAVPKLQAAGWDVAVAPDFPCRIVRADGGFDAESRESSGVDWLELHLGVTVDGERVDLIEPLVALIGSPGFSPSMFDGLDEEGGEALFLPLADGRVLAMPLARLKPMVEAMRELAFGPDRSAGTLRLSTLDAARLAEFEAATVGAELRWRGGDASASSAAGSLSRPACRPWMCWRRPSGPYSTLIGRRGCPGCRCCARWGSAASWPTT